MWNMVTMSDKKRYLVDVTNCDQGTIGGEDDKTVGVQGSYELHEGIAGSELYVYPGLGHAAYEEAKDFNQRVFDFLEKE